MEQFRPGKLLLVGLGAIVIVAVLLTLIFKSSDNSVNGSPSPWQEQRAVMREAMDMAREAQRLQREDMELRMREMEMWEGGFEEPVGYEDETVGYYEEAAGYGDGWDY
jgi:hypothetical protein